MRRVGYRAEIAAMPPEEAAAGWHLRSQWPSTSCADPAVRAAVAVMAIDAFVGPAAMRANGITLEGLTADECFTTRVRAIDLTELQIELEIPVGAGRGGEDQELADAKKANADELRRQDDELEAARRKHARTVLATQRRLLKAYVDAILRAEDGGEKALVERLRKEKLARQKATGVVPLNTKLAPRPERIP